VKNISQNSPGVSQNLKCAPPEYKVLPLGTTCSVNKLKTNKEGTCELQLEFTEMNNE
jgi:hypothetical protein